MFTLCFILKWTTRSSHSLIKRTGEWGMFVLSGPGCSFKWDPTMLVKSRLFSLRAPTIMVPVSLQGLVYDSRGQMRGTKEEIHFFDVLQPKLQNL